MAYVDAFLKNIQDWDEMNTEYLNHFKDGVYPARQTVGVDMNYLVEMSCVAIIPMDFNVHIVP